MVKLGRGQAILGGYSSSSGWSFKPEIYHMTCSNRNCLISPLNTELSMPRSDYVAIPIPDEIAGCITAGIVDIASKLL